MTETNGLHVVLGASGGTGGAVVRELVSHGRRVRAVNRSGRAVVPAGVEVLKADAADPERMRQVCRGATVVYNCVNPPFTRWTETFPPIMQAVIEGAAAAGAKLVFADDTWMYGRVNGPMTYLTGPSAIRGSCPPAPPRTGSAPAPTPRPARTTPGRGRW